MQFFDKHLQEGFKMCFDTAKDIVDVESFSFFAALSTYTTIDLMNNSNTGDLIVWSQCHIFRFGPKILTLHTEDSQRIFLTCMNVV